MNVRAFLALTLALSACGDDDGPANEDMQVNADGGGEGAVDFRPDCEPLNPEYCGLPFPSDYWLADDASTVTGHRLNVGEGSLPYDGRGTGIAMDPAPLNQRDGWSINASLIAFLPGATAEGLPNPLQVEQSLGADSPSIILNAETGERVPHWTELDEYYPEVDKALLLRGAAPFEHNTRYIVALRNVRGADGSVLPASPTFAALRDSETSEVETVEPRREHFEGIFSTLEAAGISRTDLQLAWDFTTGSVENDTRTLIATRDRALEAAGEMGPTFEIIEQIEYTEDEDPNIRRRVVGLMNVPLFLDQPDQPARLNLDADGLPVQNGMAQYPFTVHIPHSASAENPATPLLYGHGQLGSREEIQAGHLKLQANESNFIMVSVDFAGFASDDIGQVFGALTRRNLEDWVHIVDRQHQGLINFLLAARMIHGNFATSETADFGGGSVVNTDEIYYLGASQGGIFGATLMAIWTDITRGVLVVPGQPYQLLLTRSKNFDAYAPVLERSVPRGPVTNMALSYIQHMWDRVEPGSYSGHIRENLLPGTPAHEVLLLVAMGDQQVTTLGAHTMARAVGAPVLAPAPRSLFGIEEVTAPHTGSAIIEFDFGAPMEPITNTPPREGRDTHGSLADHPTVPARIDTFLRTGVIEHPCEGSCDPE